MNDNSKRDRNKEKRKSLVSIVKKISAYFSIFSLGVICGLYIFFPKDLVKNLLNKSGNIYVDDVKLLFPPGIALQSLDLKMNGKEIRFDQVSISPSLFSLFTLLSGEIPFYIKIKTHLSSVKAELSFLKSSGSFVTSKVKSEGVVDLKDVSQFIDVVARGLIRYSIEISGFEKGVTAVSGKVNLYTEKMTLEIVNSAKLGSFFEGELSLGKTKVEALINQGFLRFLNFKSEGGDVEGVISGTVRFERSLQNSQLDLTVELKTKIINIPKQKFRIRGTLSSPQIS